MEDSSPLVGCLVSGFPSVHGFRGAQLSETASKEDEIGSKYIHAKYFVNTFGVRLSWTILDRFQNLRFKHGNCI